MKHIKHLSMAAVMTLILALTTPAGQIHTGILPPPPPPSVGPSSSAANALSANQSDQAPSTLHGEILLMFLRVFSVVY